MRSLLRVVAVSLALSPFALAPSPSHNPTYRRQRASHRPRLQCRPQGVATNWRAIHNSALVVDTHADTPGRFVDENFDLSQDAGKGYMDFAKIKAGNLGAEFFSIWVEPKVYKGQEIKRALDMIDSVYEQARLHPDKMMMAFSTQDILTAHRAA